MNGLYNTLESAREGQWLYIEGSPQSPTFHVTDGFLSKVIHFVEDLFFNGFSSAQKTQEALDNVFFSTDLTPRKLIKEPFSKISELERCVTCIQKLKEVNLTGWIRNPVTIPDAPLLSKIKLDSSFFDSQHKKAEAVLKILPQDSAIRKIVSKFFDRFVVKLKGLKETEFVDYSTHRPYYWLQALKALKVVKQNLLGLTDFYNSTLDTSPWQYHFGPWMAAPCTTQHTDPNGNQKQIDYIEISYKYPKKFMEDSAPSQFDFNDHLASLQSYVEKLPPSQRRPIIIHLPQPSFISPSAQLPLKYFEKDLLDLVKNPNYFVHNIDVGVKCLSGVKNSNKKMETPKRFLREDARQTVARLKSTENFSLNAQGRSRFSTINTVNLEQEIDSSKEGEILKALQGLKMGTEEVISLNGKTFRCHKEIFDAAFPGLSGKPGLAEHLQEKQIPEGFEEWIVKALLTYAYRRKHPTSHSVSSEEGMEAYKIYFQLIDHLAK